MSEIFKNKTWKLGGDIDINRFGYGAMRITGKGYMGPPKDETEAIKVLRRAVDLGVNFIEVGS